MSSWFASSQAQEVDAGPEIAPAGPASKDINSQLASLAQDSLSEVVRLCGVGAAPEGVESGDWSVVCESDRVKVLERNDWLESSQFPTVKTVGIVDLPADSRSNSSVEEKCRLIFAHLCTDDLSVRQEWDRELQGMHQIYSGSFLPGRHIANANYKAETGETGETGAENYDRRGEQSTEASLSAGAYSQGVDGTLSVVYRKYSAPVRGIAGRDFVAINGKCEHSGALISFGRSVVFPGAPEPGTDGLVRGNAMVSGIIVRPLGTSQCEITRLLHLEPRGNIPSWVVNMTKKKNLQSFERILSLVPKWLEQLGSSAASKLVCGVVSLPDATPGRAPRNSAALPAELSIDEGSLVLASSVDETLESLGGSRSSSAPSARFVEPLSLTDLNGDRSAEMVTEYQFEDGVEENGWLLEQEHGSPSEASILVESALAATQVNAALGATMSELAASVGHLQLQLRETNERLEILQRAQRTQQRVADGERVSEGTMWQALAFAGAVIWPLIVFALDS